MQEFEITSDTTKEDLLENWDKLSPEQQGRVARGDYSPPALTEPYLWFSHTALRDVDVRACYCSMRLLLSQHRHCCLNYLKHYLRRLTSGDNRATIAAVI